MIAIISYKPSWPADFHQIAQSIRSALGVLALRIDHIGSTSVPGLAAKDKMDIRVTVADLSSVIETSLQKIGLNLVERISQDHISPDYDAPPTSGSSGFSPLRPVSVRPMSMCP